LFLKIWLVLFGFGDIQFGTPGNLSTAQVPHALCRTQFPLSSDMIVGVQTAPIRSEFSYDASRAFACDADWSTTGSGIEAAETSLGLILSLVGVPDPVCQKTGKSRR
jgi:hypothetical protein